MTSAAIAYTALPDSVAAGAALGAELNAALHGQPPDAVILFASSRYDYVSLLRALDSACHPSALVGCSSAGEFAGASQGEGAACAVALRAPDMRFAAAVGRGLRADRVAAARQLAGSLHGPAAPEYRYRSALVLTDALAGYADDFLQQLTVLTAGAYRFFGGGAGDDAQFRQTHVFCGTEAIPDAAVALEILSNKPIGVGVRHGWQPASPPLRVTQSHGLRLVSLDAAPAVESFQEHAEATAQRFDPADPLPFFLHNVLGVAAGGGYKLRVPLGVEPDGAVACAADVPEGATAHIMGATSASAVTAAAEATQAALQQLGGRRPRVALLFDCVATRLRLGKEFGLELQSVQRLLGDAPCVGFNTYGQIARVEGQFSGFHNCTAVVCVIPE
jgi:hypothetical protein